MVLPCKTDATQYIEQQQVENYSPHRRRPVPASPPSSLASCSALFLANSASSQAPSKALKSKFSSSFRWNFLLMPHFLVNAPGVKVFSSDFALPLGGFGAPTPGGPLPPRTLWW